MNDMTVNAYTFQSYYSLYNDQTKGINKTYKNFWPRILRYKCYFYWKLPMAILWESTEDSISNSKFLLLFYLTEKISGVFSSYDGSGYIGDYDIETT